MRLAKLSGETLGSGRQYQLMNETYLIDRQGIEEALINHSRGVDRADAALLGTAYHDDAIVDYGSFVGAAQDFVSFVTGAHKQGIISLHRTSNTAIRIIDSQAVSESYATAYVEVGGVQRLVLGRYLDMHEKRQGVWRLTKRFYTMEGNTNKPTNANRPDPAADDANIQGLPAPTIPPLDFLLISNFQKRHHVSLYPQKGRV